MSDSVLTEPLATDEALSSRVRAGAGPAFLIIGAAKSGTTSLWAYLRQHPEVFLPDVKEPNYFAFGPAGPSLAGPAPADLLQAKLYRRTVTAPEAYLDLFEPAPEGTMAGEASVRYLYYSSAAPRIGSALPDARLVVILRDPVERLVSHYEMNRAAGIEPLSLPSALEEEDARVAAGWGWDWHYSRLGQYAEQVRRYQDALDAGRLLVLEYPTFRDRPLETYADVCRHLGVDHTFIPDMSLRSKETYRPRSNVVDALMSHPKVASATRHLGVRRVARAARRQVRALNRAPGQVLDPTLHAQLALKFAGDVRQLEDMVGRALPSLRQPS